MPEGIEVRLLAEEVAGLITKRKLTAVKILSGRYKKTPPPGLNPLKTKLPLTVKSVGVRGKLMWWEFSNDSFMLSTLGMTGAWTLKPTEYNKVEFTFSGGEKTIKLFLFDIRNFATLKITTKLTFERKLKAMGVDMFSRAWTVAKFIADVENFRGNIAEALLSQKIVAGPGAYIIAESLFRARIAPGRKVSSLSKHELENIHNSIREVAAASYRANKIAISIHTLTEDIKAVNKFKFKIYEKELDPDGNKIAIFHVKSRSIKWVPAVQK